MACGNNEVSPHTIKLMGSAAMSVPLHTAHFQRQVIQSIGDTQPAKSVKQPSAVNKEKLGVAQPKNSNNPKPSTPQGPFPMNRSTPYPKPERRGGWYTKYVSTEDSTHLLIGKDGSLTTAYPHVHVIHDDSKGEVRVVLSRGDHDHPEMTTIPSGASPAEVDKAIADMITRL